jgi:Holliday junction DNA helicase RuvA
MIAQMRGMILEKQATHLILDVQGVGYKINISLQTHQQLAEIGAEEKLFTIYAVRNDAHQITDTHLLYGFKTELERSLFEKLISVSGVGLNTARLALSSFQVSELVHAIEQEDAKLICSVKGIGEKSAQRIIIDLKDKLKDLKNQLLSGGVSVKNSAQQDAYLALQALGFSDKAIDQAMKKVQKEDGVQATEGLIRAVLKVI